MTDSVREARQQQDRAADPAVSVVLEAAAGSGKTRVLVDRYLRLCLAGSGADPQAVLAITFTRKATIEIRERIQQRVLELARRSGDALDGSLRELLGREPTAPERQRAAWLHDVLLADPAGQGIDTLHAFCQRVLGRFAAEAGLDPTFTVLDERQEDEVREEALDRLETALARDAQQLRLYAGLADGFGRSRKAVATLFGQRVHLQRWLDRVSPPQGAAAAALARPLVSCLPAALADLHAALLGDTVWREDPGVDGAALAPLLAAALRDLADPGLAAVRAQAGEKQTEKLRDGFAQLAAAARELATACERDPRTCPDLVVPDVQALLLTRDGSVRRKLATGSNVPAACRSAFASATRPVLAALQQVGLRVLYQRNAALLRFALGAFDHYAALKRRDRALDFQDLEYLALRLLTDAETGPQVHFRLDARLDHLLLDEFQDTNRNQWDLLHPLLDEILAGGEGPPRTAFIVGDVKQAIYGFRGADSGVFRRARDWIGTFAQARVLALPTNFRSVPAVVEAVGDLFTREPLAGILGDEVEGARQLAARADAGRVVFVRPFDADETTSGHERAAAATVQLVQTLLAQASPRLRRDDILVLCRTKSHVAVYEAALRRAGIAFTPAGRGLLARSREVQDLLALLRWLTYPADDVAGATVLRSPLVRAPEATVQALLASRLQGRRRSLREVLAAQAGAHGLADAHRRLADWFAQAGLLTPHDLLRLVWREGQVLERFEIAGGEQARFNLLRLADIALASQRRGGSLRDLVDELDRAALVGGEEEGTLPGEDGTGRVRVMTVHAAKGLEAAVVILVDAAAALRQTSDVVQLGEPGHDGPWIAAPRRQEAGEIALPDDTTVPSPLADSLDAAAVRQRTEDAHVLYVAMTRARDQLFVLGGKNRVDRGTSYLDWLGEGDRDGAYTQDAGAYAAPVARGAASGGVVSADLARSRLRVWTPPAQTPRLRVESPSSLARGATDPTPLADQQRDADDVGAPPASPDGATRRGIAIHRWLERAARTGAMPAGAGEAWQTAAAVAANPALRWVLWPDATVHGYCEQMVLHRASREGRTEVRRLGAIDRLLVGPDRVDVVDYKSDRLDDPAAVDAHVARYRPQLDAYRQALTELYPDREIHGWLLFTDVTTPDGQGMLVEVDPEADA